MHVTGLITEYNPFHNGHLYHMEVAKRQTGADYLAVVMSGNFIQRGGPAIVDKYSRTKAALLAGADIVIELPAMFASSSAEDFAGCSIALLTGLGVVDSLCFGSEWGSLPLLKKAAKLLLSEPPEYKESLKRHLKTGLPFPAARTEALMEQTTMEDFPQLKEIFSSPNNILAIEYIKAIRKQKSPIKPATIKRHIAGYHEEDLNASISSATAIRRMLELEKDKNQGLSSVKDQVPPFTAKLLKDAPLLSTDDFSSLLSYELLRAREDSLTEYMDLSPDLAARMIKYRYDYCKISQFTTLLKTRQYTHTRISRALYHILLNIKTCEFMKYKEKNYSDYIRILGFRKSASPLLSEIKKKSTLPLVTKIADASYSLLEHEIFASQLYYSIVYHKYGITLKNEYTKGLVILP